VLWLVICTNNDTVHELLARSADGHACSDQVANDPGERSQTCARPRLMAQAMCAHTRCLQ
jgi:hypothetical protein